MSEDPGSATEAGTADVDEEITDAGTATEDASDDQTDLAADVEKWKGLARKHEGRAKANASAATELAALKQAGMTEAEKTASQLAEVTRERDEARADHSRIMAAAAHDLPVELIDDLGAGTDEEINERAERISGAIEAEVQKRVDALVGAGNGPRNGNQGGRPVESMRMGSAPATGDTPTDANGWFRQLLDNR